MRKRKPGEEPIYPVARHPRRVFSGTRMESVEKVEAAQFLGQEFLTWLWWRSEQTNGKMSVDGIGEPFDLFLEAPVRLVSDYGEATVVALTGGTPLDSPEARQAAREGKKLERARVRIIAKNQTYTFALDASSLAVSGLKLPVPPNVAANEMIHARMEILEEFDQFFAQLFDAFLTIRLDAKRWSGERRQIADWVRAVEAA
jgi:hypothetical protein